MPVYLINRADRPMRLLNTLKELRQVDGVNCVTRIEAVLPEEAKKQRHKFLDRSVYDNIINNQGDTLKIPTWGALACAMSHRECWLMVHRDEQEFSFIVEDDIEIYDRELFLYTRSEAVDLLNTNNFKDSPVMILLGANVVSQNTKKINDRLDEVTGPFTGSHFYLINWLGAEYLLDKIVRFMYQVDIEMGLLAKNCSDLHIYNYRESGVRQRSVSNLPSDIQVLHYDEVGIQRLIDYLPGSSQARLLLPKYLVKHIISFLPTSKGYYQYLHNLYHSNNNRAPFYNHHPYPDPFF